MSSKQVVLVFGATGIQGGSVVRWLLEDGTFAVRAASRSATGAKAQELAAKGVEVVTANQHDEQAVAKAMEGVYAVFAVTQFWDPENQGQEEALGTKLVKAAKAAGVTHFIWSSLPDVEKITKGKWQVPHFTDKAKVAAAVKEQGFQHTTFINAAAYYSNFKQFFAPRKADDGTLVFTLPLQPESMYAAFDTDDMGIGVLAALMHPQQWGSGQAIAMVGTNQPIAKYIEQFAAVTQQKARYETMPLDAFEKAAGKEIAQMLGYFDEFGYFGDMDPNTGNKAAESVGKKLTTWEEWLKTTGWRG